MKSRKSKALKLTIYVNCPPPSQMWYTCDIHHVLGLILWLPLNFFDFQEFLKTFSIEFDFKLGVNDTKLQLGELGTLPSGADTGFKWGGGQDFLGTKFFLTLKTQKESKLMTKD